MKIFTFQLCFFFSLFLSNMRPGSAQVFVLDNLGETSMGSIIVGDGDGMGTDHIQAQEFTTDPIMAYIGDITVIIDVADDGIGLPVFQVDIYSESGGDPNSSILTLGGLNNPAVGQGLYYGFITFNPNTTYFIVVSAFNAFPPYELDVVGTGWTTGPELDYSAPSEIRTSTSGTGGPWSTTNLRRFRFQLILDDATLPVELVDFIAIYEGRTTYLEWETASEQNNDYFEVQHSLDGKAWEIIGVREAGGTTNLPQFYDIKHNSPADGINYYRLKQVDLDGQFEYSKVISLDCTAEIGPVGAFYPNPSKPGIVHLNYFAQNKDELMISVFELSGKLVINHIQQVAKGDNNLSFDFTTLSTGIYFVKIGDEGHPTHRKLVIE